MLKVEQVLVQLRLRDLVLLSNNPQSTAWPSADELTLLPVTVTSRPSLDLDDKFYDLGLGTYGFALEGPGLSLGLDSWIDNFLHHTET